MDVEDVLIKLREFRKTFQIGGNEDVELSEIIRMLEKKRDRFKYPLKIVINSNDFEDD